MGGSPWACAPVVFVGFLWCWLRSACTMRAGAWREPWAKGHQHVREWLMGVVLFLHPVPHASVPFAQPRQLRRMPCSEDIHLEDVVACTAGFSGAECVSVAREAALAALSESMDAAFVSQRHLLAAAGRVVRDGCMCSHLPRHPSLSFFPRRVLLLLLWLCVVAVGVVV